MAKSIYGGIRATEGDSRLVYGIVTSLSPLTVRVDSSLTLSEGQLIVPGGIYSRSCTVEVNGTTYAGTVSSTLSVGSRLLMIREGGGQRYAVIDAAV